jgi:hypothetical protein
MVRQLQGQLTIASDRNGARFLLDLPILVERARVAE